MLAASRAKARAESVPVNFLQADMRRFDLPGRFSTILIPGNSLLHLLTIDDLKRWFIDEAFEALTVLPPARSCRPYAWPYHHTLTIGSGVTVAGTNSGPRAHAR